MKMNKLVALLAALCILCSALPMMSLTASAAEITLTDSYEAHKYVAGDTITGVNVNRGNNTLIKFESGFDLLTSDAKWLYNYEWCQKLYDAYGAGYTCTNSYGYEVAVNQYGLVTEVSSAGNMKIPDGGYVLSGFDAYHQNLKNNVAVGDYIILKDNTYYVYRTTADSKFSGDGHSNTLDIPRSTALKITDGGDGVRTGTNEWSNDVLIKATCTGADGTANHAGYVVKFGGGNIEVPEGYYAISFSGQTMHDTGEYAYNGSYLFQQFAAPGTIVNLGTNEIYFRHDVDAAKRAALLMTGRTDDTVTETYAYSANAIVTDAKTNYELVDLDAMQALYDNMAAIADEVQSMTTVDEMEPYMATLYQNYEALSLLEFEKRPVEMRAVWIRPLPNDRVERTAEELDAMLEAQILEQVELGYNQIFVEAFYNSCTIFPVPETTGHKNLYYSQNPYLVPTNMTTGSAGLYGKNSKLTEPYDMLQRFIEICRENNVEPHIWWEVFYVGYERTDPSMTDSLFEYSVAKQVMDSLDKGETTYQNWLNESQNGSYYYGAETDSAHQYFLSPASDNVRTFLLNTFEYIFETYDAESLQLDYIRYPHTNSQKCFGYDAGTLREFRQSDLYDPAKHTDEYLATYEGFYDEAWVQFRANFVTTFIEAVRAKIEEVNPSYYLTSSPGPDPADSKKNLMQDIEYWLENDLIDVLYPMAYGENVPGMVSPELVENNPNHFVCVGTSAGYDSDAYEQRWLKEVRDAGADGIAGFGTIDSWKSYAWSEDAVTPTGNATNAASVYLNEVLFARAAKMLALGDIDEAAYNAVKAAVDNATFVLSVYGVDSEEALEAINAVQAVADTLGQNPKAAMTNDVNYILKIRNNSHDAYKADKIAADLDTTLTVNEALVTDGCEDFVFNPSTMTLYVTADNAVVSGEMTEDIAVILADGVTELEFRNVTFASNTMKTETASELTVYLDGVNRFNGDLPADITYIGTGEIYNGDALVMCKGDVDGDDELSSDDLRSLLRYNVKAETYTDEQILIGDVNGDGKVNTIDTRSFLNKLVNQL